MVFSLATSCLIGTTLRSACNPQSLLSGDESLCPSSLLTRPSNSVLTMSLAGHPSLHSNLCCFCHFATSDLLTMCLHFSTSLPPPIHPLTTSHPSTTYLSIHLQSIHLPPTYQPMYLPPIPSSIYLLSTHYHSSLHLPLLLSSTMSPFF